MQACLQGDPQAWHALVERYQRLVYAIPRQYGLSTTAAEDIKQTVFLTLSRHLETLRDQTIVSAWLIQVTSRVTLEYLEQRYTDAALLGDTTEPKVRESCQLEQPQRLLTHAELANQRGWPVDRNGPMRARAFQKLQEVLREMAVDLSRAGKDHVP